MSKHSLHPYYLQQMGIESWLLRPKAPKARVKLMVMGVGLDGESRLLMNMLKSIDLSVEDVCVFSIEPVSTFDVYFDKIEQFTPCAFFLMGDVPEIDAVKTNYPGIPLIQSPHPIDLIQTPANKKQAYHDLLAAQRWLAAC